MIIGIGTDIIDARRIERAIGCHGDRFLNKIFTPLERKRADAKAKPYLSYAKLFAAKEALIKAISNTDGMTWHDMEVRHADNGKPYLKVRGRALINIQHLLDAEASLKVDLSISDEPPYATAFVVISAN